MVISRTPFRISFVGGGTDLPAFYEKQQGSVISTAINKYVYITVNKHFDGAIRASYSKTEVAENIEGIQHELFRETMREAGIWSGIEVTSVADFPAGTGMGSSSSFTVGLMNALLRYQGHDSINREKLAQVACRIEMDVLKEPIGKQDQYAAAFGDLQRYLFNPDGSVTQEQTFCSPERRTAFFDHLMLFYLGGTRSASETLRNAEIGHLSALRGLVDDFWAVLTGMGDLRPLGEILHEGWGNKKRMGGVTNSVIDEAYDTARRAGALGGKILGAGQAGFLLLFVEPKKRLDILRALQQYREVSFEYEEGGSRIIYAE